MGISIGMGICWERKKGIDEKKEAHKVEREFLAAVSFFGEL